jgi:hypothetical protein
MPFSDAPDREAAWLNTSGDGLPSLNATAGGPFQIIQARWPRVPAMSKRGLYVLRAPGTSYRVDRYAAPRSILTTEFMLKLIWPLTSGLGSAESDELAFEQAIDSLLTRIEGFVGDKTHGARFLSVGEGRSGISVHQEDPEQTLKERLFRATVLYSADDPEIAN